MHVSLCKHQIRRTHMKEDKEGEWWVAKLQCFHLLSRSFKCSPSTSFNLGVRNPSAHNIHGPPVPLPCASTARRTLRAVYTGFSRAAACWFQLGSSHSGASFQRPGRPLHRITGCHVGPAVYYMGYVREMGDDTDWCLLSFRHIPTQPRRAT